MIITMSEAFQRLVRQRQIALKEGAKIIRSVIEKNPRNNGYTTHELYELAHHVPPPPGYLPMSAPAPATPKPNKNMGIHRPTPLPYPPHPEHPVKSMSFLKNSILPFLESAFVLRKTHMKLPKGHQLTETDASVTESATKGGKENKKAAAAVSADTEDIWRWLPVPQGEIPKSPSIEKGKLWGVELGNGEDLSHLSQRRAKDRRKEILKELHAMKVAAGIENYKARSRAGAELRKRQAAQRLSDEQRKKEMPQERREAVKPSTRFGLKKF